MLAFSQHWDSDSILYYDNLRSARSATCACNASFNLAVNGVAFETYTGLPCHNDMDHALLVG